MVGKTRPYSIKQFQNTRCQLVAHKRSHLDGCEQFTYYYRDFTKTLPELHPNFTVYAG